MQLAMELEIKATKEANEQVEHTKTGTIDKTNLCPLTMSYDVGWNKHSSANR